MKLNSFYWLLSLSVASLTSSKLVAGYGDYISLLDEPDFLVADFTYDLEFDYHTENYGGAYSGPDAPSDGYAYELN